MTVDTQKLRELLAGLPTEPGCRHLAVSYSPKRIGFGHGGGPAWFLATAGSFTNTSEVLQYLRSISELLNALPALIDEIDMQREIEERNASLDEECGRLERENDRLSAEVQARQWQPIETAPKDGRQMILLLTPSRWPQVAWSNTWWTAGFSVECKPTHWMPLPPAPHQGEKDV